MRRWMASVLLFAAGVGVGAWLMQPSAAQRAPALGLRLNHVGLFVEDFDESLRWYTQTLGLREAFTIRDQAGNPTLAYLHVTRDTFIEIAPASEQRPVGIGHVAIWPADLDETIATLRARGVEIADPRTGSSGTRIANVTDPNGVRIELVDFVAGSAARTAIDAHAGE
jgi:catechol 2,3-dioxygenase-like lactoylglutathione lyase family enzyme